MKKSVLFVSVVLAASVCSAQWLERQVVIGDTFGGISLEGGIVVNPVSGNVYIESDPIQVFNPVTREKLRALDVPGYVVFCPASGKGYIFDVYGTDSALIVDAAADTTIGVAVLPFIPDLFVYNSVVNRLYLVHGSTSEIVTFDPAGDSVLDTIEVGGTVRSLIVDSTRNRLYVGTNLWELDVVDCSLDSVVAEVEVDLEYLDMMALSTATHKVYCAGTSDTALIVVSTDSLRSVGSVPLGAELEFMVSNPVADRLYCLRNDTLYTVDCQSDTIRAVREAPGAVLAVSTLSGRTYVGRSDSAQVLVIDTSDAIVGSIQLPAVPTHGVPALTFSPGRNELYGVTSGNLAFTINASTDTLTGTLNYAVYLPRQMVHNPAGNKLYLLCPSQDDLLVMDSTFGAPKHILGGATDSDALPVLNPILNRLYVADGGQLRVIDCNSDSLLESKRMYGISVPVPVMVPYLNKLYVFEGSGGADSVYAYDCLRNTVASILYLPDAVPSAVFDPRTNRIYFACEDAPTIRALNPVTGVIERTFDLVGGSRDGRLALNLDLGRLYYTDQSPNMMFTIDLLADSVMVSESLPWDIDTMFLDRRLGKLYLCSRDTARVLVFDCSKGTIVDTIAADYHYAGLLDEINDKLYLRYGAVVDCRYDSVVTRLDSISPRSMAWDMVDNRVFQATTSRLYVYRDDPYGIEEQTAGLPEKRHATIVRGVLFLPSSLLTANSSLLSIDGRKVLDLQPGANDVRALPAGVYFIRSGPSAVSRQPSAVTKVVIQR